MTLELNKMKVKKMYGYDLSARSRRDDGIAYAAIEMAGISEKDLDRILGEHIAKRILKAFVPIYGEMQLRKFQAAEQIKAYRENRKAQGLHSDDDEGIRNYYESLIKKSRKGVRDIGASSEIERVVGEVRK